MKRDCVTTVNAHSVRDASVCERSQTRKQETTTMRERLLIAQRKPLSSTLSKFKLKEYLLIITKHILLKNL